VFLELLSAKYRLRQAWLVLAMQAFTIKGYVSRAVVSVCIGDPKILHVVVLCTFPLCGRYGMDSRLRIKPSRLNTGAR
jgi:hypothetical protein